jgi:phage portal protein BeeE
MIQKKNNNKKINNKKKSHPNLFRLSKRPNINLTEGKQKRKSQNSR